MNRTTGDRIRALRSTKAWSQEELALAADVGVRTVQRVESGETPSPETLKALAAALDVDVAALKTGLTQVELAELRDAYTCPHCGAALSERSFVEHEHGNTEFEVFDCGHTRGWADRPCPADPRFPTFDDYDLHFVQDSNGESFCFAVGRTPYARQVGLQDGRGQTREEAEAWVRYSYIAAKEGFAAAEKQLCERLRKLDSLSELSRLSMAIWRPRD